MRIFTDSIVGLDNMGATVDGIQGRSRKVMIGVVMLLTRSQVFWKQEDMVLGL